MNREDVVYLIAFGVVLACLLAVGAALALGQTVRTQRGTATSRVRFDTDNDAEPKSEPTWRTEGVEKDKLAGEPKITRKGKAITRPEAIRAVEGKDVPDDAARLRLTVIGPEAERKQVLADLERAPELAAWKGKLVVQGYAPDNWAVARYGFVTGGKPTVYLQAPTGEVLHRQDDYDGPAALAEAIRKADPSYNPALDPDLRKPAPAPVTPPVPSLPDLSAAKNVPWWGWAAGALGLLLLLKREDKP